MNDANLNSINGAGERKSNTPRVVIVGGGFGGLAAAKALGKAPVEVILIDRTNHHVFQPLLYQVATSVLAPSQMSSPIREVLRRHKNTTVIMGEVTGVDKAQRCVFVNDADREHVPIPYDYLILATGVRPRYFGHNEFQKFAPSLKTLADAVGIRNKILSAFEQAEAEENVDLHRELFCSMVLEKFFALLPRVCLRQRNPICKSSESKSIWATTSRRSTAKESLSLGSELRARQ